MNLNKKEIRLSGWAHTSTGDKAYAVIAKDSVITKIFAPVYATENTALVLSIEKRPTIGSDTGRSVIDTITFPASDQQGKIYFVEPNASVNAGDELVLEVTTNSTGAKVRELIIELLEGVSSPANVADMIESA